MTTRDDGAEIRLYACTHQVSKRRARKELAPERRRRAWRERTGISAGGMDGDIVPMIEAPKPATDDRLDRVRWGI